jgi:hypothetical protein
MTPRFLVVLLLSLAWHRSALAAAVVFPGADPGPTWASQGDHPFTLRNGIVAASWRATGGVLHPVEVVNRLTGKRYDRLPSVVAAASRAGADHDRGGGDRFSRDCRAVIPVWLLNCRAKNCGLE